LFIDVLFGGLNSLKEYIALHVLTCLIPAFLLAGGIVTFVRRETIIGYLGADARKLPPLALPLEAASLWRHVPARSFQYPAASNVAVPVLVLPLSCCG